MQFQPFSIQQGNCLRQYKKCSILVLIFVSQCQDLSHLHVEHFKDKVKLDKPKLFAINLNVLARSSILKCCFRRIIGYNFKNFPYGSLGILHVLKYLEAVSLVCGFSLVAYKSFCCQKRRKCVTTEHETGLFMCVTSWSARLVLNLLWKNWCAVGFIKGLSVWAWLEDFWIGEWVFVYFTRWIIGRGSSGSHADVISCQR